MGQRSVAADHLRADDIVDLLPALQDPQLHPWVWQPFGPDADVRNQAVDTARDIAQYEYARVETVETRPDGSAVVYTDQINLTVPAGYQFPVIDHDL